MAHQFPSFRRLAGAFFPFAGASRGRGLKPPNPERPCIVCQTPHRHAQPYCSAECCAKAKEDRRVR